MTDDTRIMQRIRERAYEIWLREGQPQGRAEEHWERAKQEIMGDRSPPLQPDFIVNQVEGRLVDQGEGQPPGVCHEW